MRLLDRRAVRALLPPVIVLAAMAACTVETEAPTRRRANSAMQVAKEIVIVPRTPELVLYPCSQCHAEREPNPSPRRLTTFHTEKSIDHSPVMPWCDSCHTIDDIDQLHLVDGTQVSFDEAYRLCGQCHGDRLRDFENGTHGISSGRWSRRIERRSCTACHDPHAPEPLRFEALPSPQRERPSTP